jgi:hypothetical protein
MNTHTLVFDIHRNMLNSQEGGDDDNLPVSDAYTLSIAEQTLTIS